MACSGGRFRGVVPVPMSGRRSDIPGPLGVCYGRAVNMLRPAYAPLVIGAIWHGVSGGSLVTSFASIRNKKHQNTSHVGLRNALHSDDSRQAGALDTGLGYV